MVTYYQKKIEEKAYGFDDVSIKPRGSGVRARDVDLLTPLTRNINIHLPFISAGMESVTNVKMAIAMAENGSVGILPRLDDFEEQLKQVKQVKKKVRSLVREVVQVLPGITVVEAEEMVLKSNLPVLVVVDGQSHKVMGVVIASDLSKAVNKQMHVVELMASLDDVRVKAGMTEKHYREIFAQYDSSFLVLIDEWEHCKGVLLRDDVEFALDSTGATKDNQGSLLCATTISFGEEEVERARQLIDAGADIIVVYAPNGHLREIVETVTRIRRLPTNRMFDVIAGNVTDGAVARKLIEAGADAIKVGIGAGSIAKTDSLTGVSMPQISAIMSVYEECQMHNVPIIADGGIRHSGDAAKALVAGASVVMLGSVLAGVHEAPAEEIEHQGKKWKKYLPEFYGHKAKEMIDVGEGRYVLSEGSLKGKMAEFTKNIRLTMEYAGVQTLKELREDVTFVVKTRN